MGILSISTLIFAILIFFHALFRFIEDRNLKHIAREHEMHAIPLLGKNNQESTSYKYRERKKSD
jgi:hypothetical protein